jgi:hypothetical protein
MSTELKNRLKSYERKIRVMMRAKTDGMSFAQRPIELVLDEGLPPMLKKEPEGIINISKKRGDKREDKKGRKELWKVLIDHFSPDVDIKITMEPKPQCNCVMIVRK